MWCLQLWIHSCWDVWVVGYPPELLHRGDKSARPVHIAQPPDCPKGLFSWDAVSAKARGEQQRGFSTRCPGTFLSGCALTFAEASVPGLVDRAATMAVRECIGLSARFNRSLQNLPPKPSRLLLGIVASAVYVSEALCCSGSYWDAVTKRCLSTLFHIS